MATTGKLQKQNNNNKGILPNNNDITLNGLQKFDIKSQCYEGVNICLCYEAKDICFINDKNFEPYVDYFFDLNNNVRRNKTFETFVKRTNEKDQTVKISSAFLDDYLSHSHKQQCQVLDLGLGEGDLSSKIAVYMKDQCNGIRYEGIDRSEKFVNETKKKLITVGVEEQNIIVGNCFGGDIDKLVDHPTLLIASQVVFYAPDINNFIDKVIRKMGTVAIIIGQSDFSFLNELSKKYAPSYKQKDTESQVKAILDTRTDVSYINLLYPSIIEFSKAKLIDKVSTAAFDLLANPSDKEARNILEFIAAAPLEYLESKGKLPEFIEDVKKHLAKVDGDIGFWNFMTIVVPSKYTSKEKLKDIWLKIQTQKFSRDLTPFENALNEGNAKVIKELFKSGLVLSRLRTQDEGFVNKLVGSISKFFEGNLFSVNNHFLIRATAAQDAETSRVIIKKLIEESKAERQNNDYSLETISSSNAHESKSNQFLKELTAKNHEYEFLGPSIFSSLFFGTMSVSAMLIQGIMLHSKGSFIGMLGVSIYVSYKYYNTGYSNLHYAAKINDLQLVKDILNSEVAQQGINDQTEEGQTVLHISVRLNFTEMALYILNYEPNIQIYDYYGKLAIHYAVENNNYLIFNKLLEVGNDISSISYNYKKSWFDSILFLSMYFTTYTFLSDSGEMLLSLQSILFGFPPINEEILDNFNFKDLPASVYTYATFCGSIKLPEIFRNLSSQSAAIHWNSNTDDSFLGYKKDSLLHIAARNNSNELVGHILYAGGDINVRNINNETPLHIASSLANYELVVKLIENGAAPNILAYKKQSFMFYFNDLFFYYSIAFGHAIQKLAKAVFSKIIHQDKFFESLQEKNSGTPLLRALVGDKINEVLQKKYIVKTQYNLDDLENRFKIAKYLIENGADVDSKFTFNLFSENDLINFAIHHSMLKTLSFVHIFKLPYLLLYLISRIVPNIDYLDEYLPHKIVHIRVIDLFDKQNQSDLEKDIYNYLKQYTTLNQYIDTAKMSFYSFEYLGYKLAMVSDNDIVQINEYGMYRGGSGKDQFIINPQFAGKEEGWKLIIKDYKLHEDTIVLTSFGCAVTSVASLYFEESMVMNKSSTVISTTNAEEIVTLYDFPIDEAPNIQFQFSKGDLICPLNTYMPQLVHAEV